MSGFLPTLFINGNETNEKLFEESTYLKMTKCSQKRSQKRVPFLEFIITGKERARRH